MAKKKQKRNIKLRLAIFLMLSLLVCTTFFFNDTLEVWVNELVNPPISEDIENCELKVHFIDVGQGDSILIELPDDKIMLVDSGPGSNEDDLLKYLNQVFAVRADRDIDYFIVTHQDEDHVGGADVVFDNFNILTFYRPNVYTDAEIKSYGYSLDDDNICNNDCYTTMIGKAYDEGCEMFVSEQAVNPLFLDDDCSYDVQFLSPTKNTYSEANNYSPMILIEYKYRKILLTGDAEKEVEDEVIEDYGNILGFLNCDVLKLGHHGSETSTSQEFLNAVHPSYAVISVGTDNTFGHPDEEVYNRVASMIGEQNIFRTDEMGNVVFGIDADNLVMGKGTIQITTLKGTIFNVHIEWWCVVLSLECILFTIIIAPKKKSK